MILLAPLFLLLPAADAIPWEGDFGAALQRAKEERKPVLIAFNMDGEAANDRMVQEVYRDARVLARASAFVCLVASKEDHGADEEPCPRFGTVSCTAHRQVEKDARREFLGGRAFVNAPQHLFVSPAGTLVFRREWEVSATQLRSMMDRALGESGSVPDPPAEGLPPFDEARWISRLRAKSVEEVREAMRELARLDRAEAQDLLEGQYARAGSNDDRVEVLRAMGEPGNARAVPFLLQVAANRDRTLRRHAIVSLEIVGDGAAADPLFEAAKKEREKTVRKELVRAVARLAPDREDVAGYVLRMTKDSDALLRGNALVASADLADGSRAREALRRALADKSTDVRGCAIWALGLAGAEEDQGRLAEVARTESDARLRPLAEGARLLLSTGGRGRPPREYVTALFFFAHDDIPHDGTWPLPPWASMPGRRF